MLGQGAHENNHTLTDRVVAGVLGGILEKLLKHRQEGAHIVLLHKGGTWGTAGDINVVYDSQRRNTSTFPWVLSAERAASSMQRRTSGCRSFRASGTKKRKRGVTWDSFRYWDSLFRARAMPPLKGRNVWENGSEHKKNNRMWDRLINRSIMW